MERWDSGAGATTNGETDWLIEEYATTRGSNSEDSDDNNVQYLFF